MHKFRLGGIGVDDASAKQLNYVPLAEYCTEPTATVRARVVWFTRCPAIPGSHTSPLISKISKPAIEAWALDGILINRRNCPDRPNI